MARLMSSGFELQSVTDGVEFDAQSGTGISIDTSIKRGGNASLKILRTGAAGRSAVALDFSSGINVVYARYYIYVATAPSAKTNIIELNQFASTPTAFGIYLDTDLTLTTYYRLSAGRQNIPGTSAPLSLNTWYRIEYKFDRTGGGANITTEARVDGKPFSSIVATNYGGGTPGRTWIGIDAGNWTETATAEIYFDDIAINDTSSSPQMSWPQEGRIVHLLPNAAGDNNGFLVQVGGTAGASNNYTRADEVPPDDVTSYNADTVLNNTDDYNIDTPSALDQTDKISFVSIGVRYSGAVETLEAGFVVRVKNSSSGTVAESSEIVPNSTSWLTNTNAAPRLYPITLYAMPGNGGIWSMDTLNTAQIGMRISSSNTNAAQISAVWMLVESTPPNMGYLKQNNLRPRVFSPGLAR